MAEGDNKLTQCVQLGDSTCNSTGDKGQRDIKEQNHAIQEQWEELKSKLSHTHKLLETAQADWLKFDTTYEHLFTWLKDMEKQVKDIVPLVTLQEKTQQRDKHQV